MPENSGAEIQQINNVNETSGKRMVLISDAHLYESSDPLHRDLAGKQSKGERLIARSMAENEKKFVLTLETAERLGSTDYLFFGGDMVTGYGERGLTGPDSQTNINKFKSTLEGYFLGTPRKYMAGGHELGYVAALSTDPEGGITEKSIEIFEGNFNELFYTFSDGSYKFVVLSSDLAMANGPTEKIQKIKEQQEEFVKDEMEYTKQGQKIVLMLHDPDALVPLSPLLDGNLDKISKTFAGHQHSQIMNDLYPYLCKTASSRILSEPLKAAFNKMFPGKAEAMWQYFQNNTENAKVWKSAKLSVIPAPGGLLGYGGGFLVAEFNETGVVVKKHSIDPK